MKKNYTIKDIKIALALNEVSSIAKISGYDINFLSGYDSNLELLKIINESTYSYLYTVNDCQVILVVSMNEEYKINFI